MPTMDLKRQNKAWNISVTLPDHKPEASLNVSFFRFAFFVGAQNQAETAELPQRRTFEAFSLWCLSFFEALPAEC